MEDADVLGLVGSVETMDDVAGARRVGVVLGGQDHGDRRARVPLEFANLVETALGCCEQRLPQRGAQTGEHGLGLRIAEPDVELDDAQTLRRQGQSAVEETDERGAAAGHLVDDRLGDGVDDVVDETGGCPWQWRVGAHAAGVGSGVAVADALEVLRRGQRNRALPVAEDEEGDLGAVEVVLDDDPIGDLEAGGGVGQRLVAVGGDDDALAGGQTIGLDDVRGTELGQGGFRLGGGVGDDRPCRGHAGGLHHLLRERLRTLEVSGLGAGAEDRERGFAQSVGDTGDERGLRSDDDEVDVEDLRQGSDRGRIRRVHSLRVGDLRDARIAGRGDHRIDLGVTTESEDEGVFAGARTDDKNLHTTSL